MILALSSNTLPVPWYRLMLNLPETSLFQISSYGVRLWAPPPTIDVPKYTMLEGFFPGPYHQPRFHRFVCFLERKANYTLLVGNLNVAFNPQAIFSGNTIEYLLGHASFLSLREEADSVLHTAVPNQTEQRMEGDFPLALWPTKVL